MPPLSYVNCNSQQQRPAIACPHDCGHRRIDRSPKRELDSRHDIVDDPEIHRNTNQFSSHLTLFDPWNVASIGAVFVAWVHRLANDARGGSKNLPDRHLDMESVDVKIFNPRLQCWNRRKLPPTSGAHASLVLGMDSEKVEKYRDRRDYRSRERAAWERPGGKGRAPISPVPPKPVVIHIAVGSRSSLKRLRSPGVIHCYGCSNRSNRLTFITQSRHIRSWGKLRMEGYEFHLHE
ncbi:hypothetical protein BDY19DRAFT_909934 [Irpex rosettiformis]|uniref:Uncharacterized protein n=1 Tax=Irpex rosettiformis TaxID=378272 RepID=A0ACB8TQK0_9APHY|nr:hypothetical protein BDY19DRAFT_909934 [Irpex rosettiformis]